MTKVVSRMTPGETAPRPPIRPSADKTQSCLRPQSRPHSRMQGLYTFQVGRKMCSHAILASHSSCSSSSSLEIRTCIRSSTVNRCFLLIRQATLTDSLTSVILFSQIRSVETAMETTMGLKCCGYVPAESHFKPPSIQSRFRIKSLDFHLDAVTGTNRSQLILSDSSPLKETSFSIHDEHCYSNQIPGDGSIVISRIPKLHLPQPSMIISTSVGVDPRLASRNGGI